MHQELPKDKQVKAEEVSLLHSSSLESARLLRRKLIENFSNFLFLLSIRLLLDPLFRILAPLDITMTSSTRLLLRHLLLRLLTKFDLDLIPEIFRTFVTSSLMYRKLNMRTLSVPSGTTLRRLKQEMLLDCLVERGEGGSHFFHFSISSFFLLCLQTFLFPCFDERTKTSVREKRKNCRVPRKRNWRNNSLCFLFPLDLTSSRRLVRLASCLHDHSVHHSTLYEPHQVVVRSLHHSPLVSVRLSLVSKPLQFRDNLRTRISKRWVNRRKKKYKV